MSRQPPTTIVAVISDTHVGSTVGLCGEQVKLDDGGTYEASPAQRWLLSCWNDYKQYVTDLCGIKGRSRKNKLVVFHLGDIIEGRHHATTQALPNMRDQQFEAERLLLPWVNMADGGFFIARGTEAHAGNAGEYERSIAEELGVKAYDWRLKVNVDGVLYDLAHHASVPGNGFTSTGARLAYLTAAQYTADGLVPPRYVLRGHSHLLDDSGERVPWTRAICVPGWQLTTAFGHKNPLRRSDVGGLVFVNNQPDFSKARYKAAPEGAYHV